MCYYDFSFFNFSFLKYFCQDFNDTLQNINLGMGLTNFTTKINTKKLSKIERESTSLDQIQKEILIGTILGDASLERNKPSHNTRLRFDQTFPMHASYLMFLYSHFYNLTGSGPKVYIRKPDPRTNKIYSSIAFKTYSLPCLNYYYELFYKNGTKIVPSNIEELLTPRVLAFWICDDGSRTVHKQTILHTRSYTLNEINLLQKALKNKFDLDTQKYEKESNQWIIIIPVKQSIKLKEIVLPFMHYSFLYKIS